MLVVVALILESMCASVRELHTEAPAALVLPLSPENHSLRSETSSSSIRPSHVISLRGSLTWPALSLYTWLSVSGQEAEEEEAEPSHLFLSGSRGDGGGMDGGREG